MIIPKYPHLSPPPTIDWGPGMAKVGDTWIPGDAALQLQGPFTGAGDTVAALTVYTVDIRRNRQVHASIELTKDDIVILRRKLLQLLQVTQPDPPSVPIWPDQ